MRGVADSGDMPMSLHRGSFDRGFDAFVAATLGALHRELEAVATRYVEPRPNVGARRGLSLAMSAGESAYGFAIGAIAAAVMHAARTWLGDAASTTAAHTLAELTEPAPRADPPRYLADAEARPLVERFAAHVSMRLATARRDLELIAAAVVASAPERSRAIAMMFDELSRDGRIAERFRGELGAGLSHLALAVGDDCTPAASSALWCEWSRLVRGKRDQGSRPYIVVVG